MEPLVFGQSSEEWVSIMAISRYQYGPPALRQKLIPGRRMAGGNGVVYSILDTGIPPFLPMVWILDTGYWILCSTSHYLCMS